jgi:nitroreductase
LKIFGRKPDFLASLAITEHKQDPVSYCNAACIIENMALAATDLGLGNVILGGVPATVAANSDLSTDLKIPAGFMPALAIAIGKAAEPLNERELTLSKIVTDIL